MMIESLSTVNIRSAVNNCLRFNPFKAETSRYVLVRKALQLGYQRC